MEKLIHRRFDALEALLQRKHDALGRRIRRGFQEGKQTESAVAAPDLTGLEKKLLGLRHRLLWVQVACLLWMLLFSAWAWNESRKIQKEIVLRTPSSIQLEWMLRGRQVQSQQGAK